MKNKNQYNKKKNKRIKSKSKVSKKDKKHKKHNNKNNYHHYQMIYHLLIFHKNYLHKMLNKFLILMLYLRHLQMISFHNNLKPLMKNQIINLKVQILDVKDVINVIPSEIFIINSILNKLLHLMTHIILTIKLNLYNLLHI